MGLITFCSAGFSLTTWRVPIPPMLDVQHVYFGFRFLDLSPKYNCVYGRRSLEEVDGGFVLYSKG